MPSRAVLRKKARRESKRRRDEAEGKTSTSKPSDVERQEVSHKAEPAASQMPKLPRKKRPREDSTNDSRAEASLSLDGVSRKERKRFEAKRRLERQLESLNRRPATANPGVPSEPQTVAPPSEEGHWRHDPKYKNGTFWRDRKERRKRTVFLGNVPAKLTEQEVIGLVTDTLRDGWMPAEEDAADEMDAVVEDVVESVDILRSMPRAKRRHMYVTLCSTQVAESVTKLLDGKMLEGIALRCNFASDKVQRSEAIKRRSAGACEHSSG